jgi:hypothetical protein
MRRSVLTGFVLALAVVFATAAATAVGTPVIRSVRASNGHLIVRFTLAQDSVPGRVLVATSRPSSPNVIPSSSVKLLEAMHASADPATGDVRWRTRKSLPAGTYYVQVSGVQAVGVTNCRPRRPDCLMSWSSPRRVVIP